MIGALSVKKDVSGLVQYDNIVVEKKCMLLSVFSDIHLTKNEHNMKPVQFCTGFMFCSFPAIVTVKIAL